MKTFHDNLSKKLTILIESDRSTELNVICDLVYDDSNGDSDVNDLKVHGKAIKCELNEKNALKLVEYIENNSEKLIDNVHISNKSQILFYFINNELSVFDLRQKKIL